MMGWDKDKITGSQLAKELGVNQQTLYGYLNKHGIYKGKPKTVELLQRIDNLGKNGAYDRSKMMRSLRPKLELMLKECEKRGYISGQEDKPLEPSNDVGKGKQRVPDKDNSDPEDRVRGLGKSRGRGIECAVERLRDGEYDLYEKWRRALETDSIEAANKLFQQWQVATEALRKGEDALLEVHKKSGALISTTAAEQFFSQRISPVKSSLLRLPSQIAPMLVGLSVTDIKDELDTFIRKLLKDIARFEGDEE